MLLSLDYLSHKLTVSIVKLRSEKAWIQTCLLLVSHEIGRWHCQAYVLVVLPLFLVHFSLTRELTMLLIEIVADQLTDFKRRLGIDYYVTGLTFDPEAIQVWLKDIGMKTKKGLVFYVKGTRLFVDDIVFCLSLIGRALQGYTLKPREVRTLR
jgi:uncharacterized protein (DUF2164 family)